MNDDATKYRTADGSPLTPSEVARLDEIETRLGNSDEIPETSDDAWETAVRGKHAKAMETAVTIRLDAEVMEWLRARGSDHSAEINRILREKMLSEAGA